MCSWITISNKVLTPQPRVQLICESLCRLRLFIHIFYEQQGSELCCVTTPTLPLLCTWLQSCSFTQAEQRVGRSPAVSSHLFHSLFFLCLSVIVLYLVSFILSPLFFLLSVSCTTILHVSQWMKLHSLRTWDMNMQTYKPYDHARKHVLNWFAWKC